MLKCLRTQSSVRFLLYLYTFLKLVTLDGRIPPLRGTFESLWRQFGSHNDDEKLLMVRE